MTFALSDTQRMLRDMLGSYLADNYSFEQRRRYAMSPAGWSSEVWQTLARELQVLGASFPESMGGFGGDAVDAMVVAEELGAVLALEPYWSTIAVAGSVLRQAGDPASVAMLKRIFQGEVTIAFGAFERAGRYDPAAIQTIVSDSRPDGYLLNGSKSVVRDAPSASHLMVTAKRSTARPGENEISIFLIERNATGLSLRPQRLLDGTRAATLSLSNVFVPARGLVGPLGGGLRLVERAIEEGTAALCAESIGILRQMHQQTIDYVKQRRQFDKSLADFQVVRHRVAEMFVEIEQARSAAWIAAVAMKNGDPAARGAVSAAAAKVLQTLKFVGQNAIQLHGGIGTTEELSIGHFFKRSTVLARQLGTIDELMAAYEDARFAAA